MASTVWHGQLTFGLVSFPVRLYTAARRERVRMHYVRHVPSRAEGAKEIPESEEPETTAEPATAEPSVAESPAVDLSPPPVTRIKQEFLPETEDRPVAGQNLLKGYEVAPEQYVTFSNEELRKLRSTTSPDMQIIRSVRLVEIDPVYFETSYYVVPDRGGERAYALLFAALRKTHYVALARVAMKGREHIVVLRPGEKGLLAHTMFYTDEIRGANEFQTNMSDVVPKELDLAVNFVEAIAGPFAPQEFKDPYRENIQNLIASKMERREVSRSVGQTAPEPAPAPVVNILDALRKSLEMTKKPAKSEAPPASRRGPSKITEIKTKTQRRKG